MVQTIYYINLWWIWTIYLTSRLILWEIRSHKKYHYQRKYHYHDIGIGPRILIKLIICDETYCYQLKWNYKMNLFVSDQNLFLVISLPLVSLHNLLQINIVWTHRNVVKIQIVFRFLPLVRSKFIIHRLDCFSFIWSCGAELLKWGLGGWCHRINVPYHIPEKF